MDNSVIYHLCTALCVNTEVKSSVPKYLTPFTLSCLPPIPLSSGDHHYLDAKCLEESYSNSLNDFL